jgi:hypothetical protein
VACFLLLLLQLAGANGGVRRRRRHRPVARPPPPQRPSPVKGARGAALFFPFSPAPLSLSPRNPKTTTTVAYVRYSKASSAALAQENLNGAVLNDGRGPKLKVLPAEPPAQRSASPAPPLGGGLGGGGVSGAGAAAAPYAPLHLQPQPPLPQHLPPRAPHSLVMPSGAGGGGGAGSAGSDGGGSAPPSADPDNFPPRSRLFLVVPKTADARVLQVRSAFFFCCSSAGQPRVRALF